MNYVLFDDAAHAGMLPFTHTRPVADVRCGILTMRERWEMMLRQSTGSLTLPYLQKVFPFAEAEESCIINGSVFATPALVAAIVNLQAGEQLVKGDLMIAARIQGKGLQHSDIKHKTAGLTTRTFDGEVRSLVNAWDIFTLNDYAIRADFAMMTAGRTSAPVPASVTVLGSEQLFIEEGANIYPGCIINASAGPVYIAGKAEVLEGTMMRGPVAIGTEAVIKMGAKIYGATTIGPGCKAGGELNNVVFFDNSNKAHDGYLGNAVIGAWCNLGADTNCSNLKNNYAEVKVWSEAIGKSVNTGLTFCGLMMGDHSKCGINTMFNTGTIVGVSCNIFGGGFPEKFVRSFSWGGSEGVSVYDFNRAMETAGRMMARRGRKLTGEETEMYRYIFDNARAGI